MLSTPAAAISNTSQSGSLNGTHSLTNDDDELVEQAPLSSPSFVQRMLFEPSTPTSKRTMDIPFPVNAATRLSAEIRRHIYSFLDEEDIQHAASVSKEYRKWAVPALMERLGVSSSKDTAQYHIRADNRGKKAAFILQFLASYPIPSPISSLKLSMSVAEHREVLQLTASFIRSRPSLGKFVLSPEYSLDSFQGNRLEMAMQGVLQAAGERGCTELVVRGGTLIPLYIMTRQPPETVESLAPMTTLQRLVLTTPLFLILHFRDWLINTLNSSPLTHLQITLVMARNVAGALLPLIDIPTLTDLDISFPLTELAEMVPFLQRHRGLRSLYIGSLRWNMHVPPASLKGLLPNLESLSADYDLLNVILGPVSSCASLRSIAILSSIPWGEGDPESTPRSWPEVPGMPSLHHPLAMICRNRTDLDLRLLIDADHIPFDHFLDMACAKWELTMETVVEQTRELLAGVTRLGLTQVKGRVRVPKWLRLFGGVRKVRIVALEEMLDAKRRKRMDEEIRVMCPKVPRGVGSG